MLEELKKIELAEEIFGTDFPLDLAEDLTVNNPRAAIDHFVLRLQGWGPNSFAADFLKQLATKQKRPALAQGLHDSWRREQISAVIQEICNTGNLAGGDDEDSEVPVRKPRGPKSGGRTSAHGADE